MQRTWSDSALPHTPFLRLLCPYFHPKHRCRTKVRDTETRLAFTMVIRKGLLLLSCRARLLNSGYQARASSSRRWVGTNRYCRFIPSDYSSRMNRCSRQSGSEPRLFPQFLRLQKPDIGRDYLAVGSGKQITVGRDVEGIVGPAEPD